MITGIVRAINRRRGMFAIEVETNDFTVVELLDSCDLELEDKVSGSLDSLGRETLKNVTQGVTFAAFIQAVNATPANAAILLK